MLEVCVVVEDGGKDGGGGGRVEELEVCVAVEEGGGVEGVGVALDTLPPPSPPLPPPSPPPPPSPLLYGGRRGKAAKENLSVLASQHAVPPDNSGRLESQQ